MTEGLDVREWFDGIDIYLFDQILKGRFPASVKILDAGCGDGRNLRYFFRSGYEVFCVDRSGAALSLVRDRARLLAPGLPPEHFRCEPIEQMSFADASFDVVISSAVLHFADDRDHFLSMLHSMWRVLAPGGMLFCRLSSTTGLESRLVPLGGGRYRLPGGAEWFLVDEETLLSLTGQLGATLLEPLKSVNVQQQRIMTTWIIQKPPAP